MFKYLSFLCFALFFVLVWATEDRTLLSDKELLILREYWDECCESNICISKSCFFIQRDSSDWSAVRQRCQGKLPDWPGSIDLFRIRKEEDLQELPYLLPRFFDNEFEDDRAPVEIWTAGVRCPQSTPKGSITRWTSTDEPFPEWLKDKIQDDVDDYSKSDCRFLVFTLTYNVSEVKYEFQDPSSSHPGICEFVFPEEAFLTLPSETTTFETTTTFERETSTKRETTSTAVQTSTTSKTESKTLEPSKKFSTTLSEELETTVRTDTTTVVFSTTTPTTTTRFSTTTKSTTTSTPSTSTTVTNIDRFCKGKREAGIDWPDTLAGTTVNKPCPEGMIGYAQWSCNNVTLQFTPKRPHVEDCKHIWIKDLEENVENGKDAVDISTELSRDTKKKNMSHGDITALIDLSVKILHLFSSQHEEENSMEANKTKPYIFTHHMVSSMSNILRAEIKDAWEILPAKHQTRAASKMLRIVTIIGSHLSCIKESESKLQHTITAENIDLQTFILNTEKRDGNIVFPQKVDGMEAYSSLAIPTHFNWKKPLTACRDYNTAVGVLYKHVGDFLNGENVSSPHIKVVTKVISFSMNNVTETTMLPEGKFVTIILRHSSSGNFPHENLRCMFWNFSKQIYGQWDDSGCFRVSSNETHVTCSCNHLTNFAVLMDVNNNVGEDEILTMMTYVCCSLSSLSLVITLICFISIRSFHGRRSIITGNLCSSLLLTNLLILFGLDQTGNKIVCAIIAGFLHFWILSAFCWMLVEGYHLYKMVVLVFERGRTLSIKVYYLFAYGTPFTIVAISAGLRKEDYGGKLHCWLSSNNGLMWSFVGPACAIILVNVVVFVLTLRSASSVRVKREQTTLKKIKNWARGSMSVMCLLGLTWCLGLFYIDKNLSVFSYIFTVLNGLQGVFIFFFHVLLNDKVISLFRCKRAKNEVWRRCLPQTSSNHLHSKLSTRTSLNSLGCASSNILGTSINSRRVPNTMSYQNSPRENDIINRPKARSNKNYTFENNKMGYRKEKASHTVSENGLSRLPLSRRFKPRSQSYPETREDDITNQNIEERY